MSETNYTSSAGTVYSVNAYNVLLSQYATIKITDPDGSIAYSTSGAGLFSSDLPAANVFTSSENFNIGISNSGTYVVVPGATGTLASAISGNGTIWVGGTLNYYAASSQISTMVFNVDGGSLNATAGAITSTGSTVTVNLTNGGRFVDNPSFISVFSGTTITFGSGGGTYVVNSNGSVINLSTTTIKGFDAARDNLEFQNLASTPVGYSITNNDGFLGLNSAQKITLLDSSGTVLSSVTVQGHNFATGAYDVSGTGPLTISASGTTVTVEAVSHVVCFLPGTLIEMLSAAPKKVEEICVGDSVVAYMNGQVVEKTVRWVGKAHAVVRPSMPDDLAGYPVRVLKDAIAENIPFKDLLVTAEHCLFLDGYFVPVRMLVNGVSIFYDKSFSEYDYYHIETEEHSVICADGVLTESYLDTGNRFAFQGDGHPPLDEQTKTWQHDAAADLNVRREFVEGLYRRFASRVDYLGLQQTVVLPAITQDPDLHLMTDTGVRLESIRKRNEAFVFIIPEGVRDIWISSRASRPYDAIGPFIDDRRSLGVLVGDIQLYGSKETRKIKDHLTGDLKGWDVSERIPCRWTRGKALLPLTEAGTEHPAVLTVQVLAAGPYIT